MSSFVFFGTSRFARIVLEELAIAGMFPAAVVTQPAKPQGRGWVVLSSETETWARAHGISALAPQNIRDNAEFIQTIASLKTQCFVVAAYGKILPKTLLDIPPKGTLNVHPSLLPRYRGPSPIESQILADEEHIGVSIMLVDEMLDHGPILASAPIARPEPWPAKGSVLTKILAHSGGRLLAPTMTEWIAGRIVAREQDHAQATLTRKWTKEDGEIDLKDNPVVNLRKIRAFDVWPGAFTFVERRGKRVRIKILDAHIESGALILDRVVPEGRREMAYEDFLRG